MEDDGPNKQNRAKRLGCKTQILCKAQTCWNGKENKGLAHPFYRLTAQLFSISYNTVQRYCMNVAASSDSERHITEPETRGPSRMTRTQARAKHLNLFDAIHKIVIDAQKNGDTLTIHTLNCAVGKIMPSSTGELMQLTCRQKQQ